MASLQPDFPPGSGWRYSNTGYAVLGYIIQRVSGMSYWQAVRTYIFTPLQMKESGFDFEHHTTSNKAVGYDVLNDTASQPATITDSTVPFAAGAIYSTVTDMYKWHKALQANQLVNSKLMEKAYTPSLQHNYGYGWQIDSVFGKKMVSHSGGITGFGSNFARIPADDVCIVLLSNKSGATFEVMNITRKLLAVLYNQPYAIPVKRISVTLPVDSLKKYTGAYEIPGIHLELTIYVQDGLLVVQPKRDGNPGPTSIMMAMDSTHFYDRRDEEIEVSFTKDGAGKVTGFTLIMQGTPYNARKIK
jgi:hypothetical protein